MTAIISLTNIDLQVVIVRQLQTVINQFIANRQAFKNRLNKIELSKAKMPLVKRFSGEKVKLKGFLI